MANLATTAVTVTRAWKNPGSRYTVKELSLVLTGQGSATNQINAATLLLTSIRRTGFAVKSDNTVILPTAPSTDGTLLLLGGGASNAPADYTGTFTLTVEGLPS